MILSGLLGRSILASRSPELHEKEAQAQGMALRYDLYDFSARGWADSDLPLVLKRLQDQGYSGFNMTYPFKQAVVSLLDELDETAVSVGAVNTVSIRNGKLYGFNTDMAGFRDSVAEGLPGVALGNVVQLGAGGAGPPSPMPCSLWVSARCNWSMWMRTAQGFWPRIWRHASPRPGSSPVLPMRSRRRLPTVSSTPRPSA